jgi:hypothetical protein
MRRVLTVAVVPSQSLGHLVRASASQSQPDSDLIGEQVAATIETVEGLSAGAKSK